MRNDNFSSIIEIKAESQTNKTIPSTLLCPLSQLIFLEPVKLLLHDQSDCGPIVEKDFADKITTCPISRIKITQRIRVREIEHLVAQFLQDYPEFKAAQYVKLINLNTPSILTREINVNVIERASSTTRSNTPPIDPVVLNQTVATPSPLVSQIGLFKHMKCGAKTASGLICAGIVGSGLSTISALTGSAVLKICGYQYDNTEAAQASATGGAIFGMSYIIMARIFAQLCAHYDLVAYRDYAHDFFGREPHPSLDRHYIIKTTLKSIPIFIGLIISSGILGAEIMDLKQMSLAQYAIAPTIGLTIMFIPILLIASVCNVEMLCKFRNPEADDNRTNTYSMAEV